MGTSLRARLPEAADVVPAIVLGGAGLLAVGVLAGLAVDVSGLVRSDGYALGAALLLAVGLYGSTYSIDLRALRADLPGVVAAVTLGVVLKAGLIAGTMMLVFGRPGVSGARYRRRPDRPVVGRRPDRQGADVTARPVAADGVGVVRRPDDGPADPVSGGVRLHSGGQRGRPEISRGAGGDYATGLLFNAVLLAVVVLSWWAGRRTLSRLPDIPAVRRTRAGGAVLLLGAMLVLAALNQLMLGVALAGLVLRAAVLDRAVGRAVGGAYLAAFLTLGLLLAHGVELWPGFVLGVAAFAAQAVVALGVMPLFVRGLERRDRIALGLGQQNGITAVLIALTLERDFPGTAATVGPAVITVNLLHGTSQALLAHPPRRWRARTRREPSSDAERHSPYDQPTEDEQPVA